MILKILIVTLFYQLAVSEQKNVETIALDYSQVEELQNLLNQLELQIDKEHKAHKYPEKPKNKEKIKSNDVMSLLLQRDDINKDRSEEGILKWADRDCKSGRCGCSGPRCGRTIPERNSDEITKLLDSLEKTIDKDMGHGDTRCAYDRCGDRDDINDRDDDLHLRGSPNIKQQLERYGKSYKLNNELDAVVLDAASVNDALVELNKHCKYANCKLINYDSKSRSTAPGISREEDSINAVILDLTHLPDNNNLAKDLNNALVKTIKADDLPKAYLSPDDLDKYYQGYKRTALSDVVDYLNDKSGRRESVKYLSGKQRQLVEDVKSILLKNGIGLKDKQVMKQIGRILFGKHSPTKIFAHSERNRNIYVPQRLYDKIDKPKRQGNLRAQKRLLPLTLKQRNKLQKKPVHLLRRNYDNNYGLPFDLQVQGLGQVVP